MQTDGRSVADCTSDAFGVSDGNALAPESTERRLLPRRAACASGGFVEEVERGLVEAPPILLGNGDEGVALGMDDFAPVDDLLVGPGISGRSRQGSTAVEVGRLGYDTGDEVDEGLGAGGRVVMNDQVRASRALEGSIRTEKPTDLSMAPHTRYEASCHSVRRWGLPSWKQRSE